MVEVHIWQEIFVQRTKKRRHIGFLALSLCEEVLG
jgi:hypothetical protein